MRGSSWITASVLALAMAGCSPHQKAAAPAATAPPAPPAPPAEAAQQQPASPAATALSPAAPPEDASAQAAAPVPLAPQVQAAQPVQVAQPVQAAPPQPYHFSPADYGSRERRINALIGNAESRDTSGETQYLAEEGRRQRQACSSKPCVEHSYAAEEARLRKWDGAGDIK